MSTERVTGYLLVSERSLRWHRRACVALVAAMVAAFYPGIADTPRQLVRFHKLFWPDAAAFHAEARAARGGEHVLPQTVRSALVLLRDNGVAVFSYSDAIRLAADPAVPQRLAESAYPIRVDDAARDRLFMVGEPMTTRCHVIARDAEVLLARCA